MINLNEYFLKIILNIRELSQLGHYLVWVLFEKDGDSINIEYINNSWKIGKSIEMKKNKKNNIIRNVSNIRTRNKNN